MTHLVIISFNVDKSSKLEPTIRAMATAKLWAMATATRVADDKGLRE